MRVEDKFLFICVRQEFLEEHKKILFGICSNEDLDWNAVYSTAELHGVAPLVYSNLKKCTDMNSMIPDQIMKKFRQCFFRNILIKDIMAKKITEAVSFFNGKNIDLMLIKGAALDILVYDSPWSVHSCDVDLILRKVKEEVSETEDKKNYSLVKRLGCVEHGYFEHHDLDMNRVLLINYQKIWDQATKIDYKGQNLFVMSPEDMLISVCINSCRKRFFRLKNLCDIAEIIRTFSDINWDAVTSKAKEYHCNNIVYTALIITKMTLGCEFPEKVLYDLEVSPVRAKIITYLSQKMSFSSLSSLYSGTDIFGKKVNSSLILPYTTYTWCQALQMIRLVFIQALYENNRKRIRISHPVIPLSRKK